MRAAKVKRKIDPELRKAVDDFKDAWLVLSKAREQGISVSIDYDNNTAFGQNIYPNGKPLRITATRHTYRNVI